MAKIGRNEPCPCGSGKKYKRCHGSHEMQEHLKGEVQKTVEHTNARRIQRQRQQGLAKPIISTEFHGQRFVVVKNRLMYSDRWKTFHSFLIDYIKTAMGPEWGTAEIAKPLEQRHPVLVWYDYLCVQQQRANKNIGEINIGPMTGAVGAYLYLAYNLYALDHNAELQEKLVNRLRDYDNFQGARYEVYVAATLIRAGFEIEFENEDDRSSSHCEFTATHVRTGEKFSVEAKHREGKKFRLGRRLIKALNKKAEHTRIVFIDINAPDETAEAEVPQLLHYVLGKLRAFEGRIINGKALPEAYLIVTNAPWQHHLESETIRWSSMAEGFQIPDFKSDASFPNLRAAINSRERHIEMYDLLRSMRDHNNIPSTFDGEIPEFAFGDSAQQLKIGQRYLVKDEDGTEVPGLLTTATVIESERTAYCAFSLDTGKSVISSWPLSDAEMDAWIQHPDTFFGIVQQRKTKTESPLELYDFFHQGYRKTSKKRLLELMAGAPNIDQLSKLEQSTLASVYAEGLTTSFLNKTQK